MGLGGAPAVSELHTVHEDAKACLFPYDSEFLLQPIAVCTLEILKITPQVENTPPIFSQLDAVKRIIDIAWLFKRKDEVGA